MLKSLVFLSFCPCVRSRMFDIAISKGRDNMRLNIRKINNYSYYSILKITLILMVKELLKYLKNLAIKIKWRKDLAKLILLIK